MAEGAQELAHKKASEKAIRKVKNMEYVRFGNTGLTVSHLCLGAMTFPETCDEQTARSIVDKALDQGISFIDTADSYGPRTSEEFLGRALKGKRDKVVLATKFWIKLYDDPVGGGCSRYHLMRTVEGALQRLQTDHIDLLQLHHPDDKTPVEETMSTLDTLIKQGKVRYWGVSNHYAWQMAHMLGVSALHNWEPLVSIQARYAITDRVVENETVPFCQRFNIAMMGYGPLDGGLLTGKYKRGELPPQGSRAAESKWFAERLSDRLFDVVELLSEIGAKYGIGNNQLALAWLLSRPLNLIPILGGSKPEHFDQVYNVCELEIDPEDLKRIDEASEWARYQPFGNQHVVGGAPLAHNRL